MTTVNIYLHFNGDCEKAFNFYKSVFDQDFQYTVRYKDVPKGARHNFQNCTDEQIMHITLPISNETILMGADIIDINNKKREFNSFSIYVNADNKIEADRLFRALSNEGKIKLQITDQFWGSYYGICVDKFGVNWKISFSSNNNQ